MTVPYQCLSTVVRTLSKVLSSVRAPGPGEEHGFEVNQPRFRFGTGEELRRDILFIHYFLPTSLCISIYSLFLLSFLYKTSFWYTFQYFPTYTILLVYFPILFYVYNLTGILSFLYFPNLPSYTFIPILSNTFLLRMQSYWYTFKYLPKYTIILVYFPILSYVYNHTGILSYTFLIYHITGILSFGLS